MCAQNGKFSRKCKIKLEFINILTKTVNPRLATKRHWIKKDSGQMLCDASLATLRDTVVRAVGADTRTATLQMSPQNHR